MFLRGIERNGMKWIKESGSSGGVSNYYAVSRCVKVFIKGLACLRKVIGKKYRLIHPFSDINMIRRKGNNQVE